jgi:hypothetical protein
MSATGTPEAKRRLGWLRALHEPSLVDGWSLAHWEYVVRLSRRLRLLARLAAALDAAGLVESVPPEPRRHLIAEQRLSRWRTGAMEWALERIGKVLSECSCPGVLLKGAAYLGQDLPIAHGRMPSDVDILVSRGRLTEAVQGLTGAGWVEAGLDEHDRRYYYEWSHEVPPMRHPLHAVELDLHHNILPPVAHVRVDADLLLCNTRPSKLNHWQVFSPVDQVIHSAAHLFFDSEARDRVRDLVDLDGLFRHFGQAADFWSALPDRATELGLTEPMALAIHYTRTWFESPIPDGVANEVASSGPQGLRGVLLRALWDRVLMPSDPDRAPPASQSLAATVLLARYHWRRMPLRLLAPHLWHQLRARRGAAEPLNQ